MFAEVFRGVFEVVDGSYDVELDVGVCGDSCSGYGRKVAFPPMRFGKASPGVDVVDDGLGNVGVRPLVERFMR